MFIQKANCILKSRLSLTHLNGENDWNRSKIVERLVRHLGNPHYRILLSFFRSSKLKGESFDSLIQ